MKKQYTTVKYPYAHDEQGILTHISEARRLHTYTCPGCREPLIPVLGESKATHFRHYEEHCSFETYLHHCAKEAFFCRYRQALKNSEPIRLELVRTVYCTSNRLKLLRDQEVQCQRKVPAYYDLTKIFNQADLEKQDNITGFKPDILLRDSTGKIRCYVEICVTHPCTQEKIDSHIPILEFKVESEADIQMLLSGSYSVRDERTSTYNFHAKPRTDDTCHDSCLVGCVEMSVWSLSESGRLNEEVIPLSRVDQVASTYINTWPKSLTNPDLIENLKSFLQYEDPRSLFQNCVRCKHSDQWNEGYLLCRTKGKQIPYTEARQCADYEMDV